MADDSEVKARQLTDAFTEYALATSYEAPDRERRRPDIRPVDRTDIVTADAARSVERFGRTLFVVRHALDNRAPAVATDTDVLPIDLSAPAEAASYSVSALRDSVRYVLRPKMFAGLRLVSLPIGDAIDAFRRSLNGFLFTRFEARERDDSERPGRQFQVTSDTEGLRIHYSTAFILERDLVFGAPTNPVRSWIQPGNYYFGGVGATVPLWFDLAAKYEVPRIGQAHLHI